MFRSVVIGVIVVVTIRKCWDAIFGDYFEPVDTSI